MKPRFEHLTETTGVPVSREGAQMLYTRYRVAADLAPGKRVIEIGCGAGQGFGLVGRVAATLVGADFSFPLLQLARSHYGTRFPLVQLSGEALPFTAASFDLLLYFETTYYVPDMISGFREITRVLAPGGTALFVNANPERPDFIRSPESRRYQTADEFRAGLTRAGFATTVEGAFPVESSSRSDGGLVRRALPVARRALASLGLVPKTLRGRARLKRLVYGRMVEVPPELHEGFAAIAPRTRLEPGPVPGFKVIYVTGRKATRAS